MLDPQQLKTWLQEAVSPIRKAVGKSMLADSILPLIFLKRLSDVFEDEVARLIEEHGDREVAESLVPFYIPPEARWRRLQEERDGLAQRLTEALRAVAQANPRLRGVVDTVDYTSVGGYTLNDRTLRRLIEVLSRYRLGLGDAEPDILSEAHEFLLRRASGGRGPDKSELHAPWEVAVLAARLLEPEPGMEVYDPSCGSGRLLVGCHLWVREVHGEGAPPLKVYGEEGSPTSFTVAYVNALVHGMEADIRLNDPLRYPAFTEGDGLRRFHLAVAAPYWKEPFPKEAYGTDPYGRFPFGAPPSSSADWGWVQHMLASLREDGRMAVLLDAGAASRGSKAKKFNREREIRRGFVEADLVEAVILLPEGIFHGKARGILLVVNRRKRYPGEILMVDASGLYLEGKPRNRLGKEHVEAIAEAYHGWRAEKGLSRIVTKREVAQRGYNLSPNYYVETEGKMERREEVLPLEEALFRLRQAGREGLKATMKLQEVLKRLGPSQ